jgi:alpha-tubulin suppressor-like RCC1 family protein
MACLVLADPPQGKIVGWGSQVVGTDMTGPFLSVAAGTHHSLGLKSDGSIVAWGDDHYGQTNVPAPNTGFIAIAAGSDQSRHQAGLQRQRLGR